MTEGRRGMRGSQKYKKFVYLANENNFLVDELKNIFHIYLRLIIIC